jgi:hypothetical protein
MLVGDKLWQRTPGRAVQGGVRHVKPQFDTKFALLTFRSCPPKAMMSFWKKRLSGSAGV